MDFSLVERKDYFIMLKQMKKRAMKDAVIGSIIIFIVAAIVMAVGLSYGLFENKTDITSAKIVDIKKTEYAEIEIDKYNLYGIFSEKYQTNNGNKTTTDYYCLILVGDQNDAIRFMAAKVPAKYEDKLNKIQEEYTELDEGVDSDDRTVIKLQGKLVKMDKSGELYEYFKAFVEEYDYTEEEIPLITLNLCLEPQSQSTGITFIVIAVILFVIGIIFILISVLFSNRKVIKKINAMDAAEAAKLEYDFQSAYQVNKKLKIGKECTYIVSGFSSKLVINSEIIWAYLNKIDHRTNGIHTATSYNIVLYDINKKKYTISVANENTAQDVLHKYSEISDKIVLGYDKKYQTMISKNLDEFLNIAYNRIR